MKRWAMIVDVAKCENCSNCFLACKDEHVGNDFPGYAASQPLHGHRWIDLYRTERGQAPMVEPASMPAMCNHCDDAPCIKASKNGAVYKRDDGIVIIDPDKAVGQRELVASCPYGAISWNEEKQLPQKWIFDAHLLDNGWKEPRCVQVCPTGALRSVKLEDAELAALAQDEELEVLSPEHDTKPRVFYKNLHLFTKCFIGGSVAAQIDGVEDCIEGASVSLQQGETTLSEQVTDAYGDFKFDKLEPGSGSYQLRIEKDDFPALVVDLELEQSTYVGVVRLQG
jgi:Fe-S-cluster-containing dehydrogenase component